MVLPKKLLLSDLLKHHVRCDMGIDHGSGLMAWMHPPVHRLLGWVSKPSNINLSREVWSLNQLRGLSNSEVFVKGNPSISDSATLDRLPTLIDSNVISNSGEKLGSIADLVFIPSTGQILNYLVSRSDPRIPGTSRWKLDIDRIYDQQPGMVSTSLLTLDDLPLIKSSFRQKLLRKSQEFKNQFDEFKSVASDKLEGWLDETPWDVDNFKKTDQYQFLNDPLDNWENDNSETKNQNAAKYRSTMHDNEEDPWI